MHAGVNGEWLLNSGLTVVNLQDIFFAKKKSYTEQHSPMCHIEIEKERKGVKK